MQIVRPKQLRVGSAIGVVSVSAPEPATEIASFDRGVAALKTGGYGVVLGKRTTEHQGYVTASGEVLAADLHELFVDDRVSAVICAGGGVNANRLLHHLSWEIIREHPLTAEVNAQPPPGRAARSRGAPNGGEARPRC